MVKNYSAIWLNRRSSLLARNAFRDLVEEGMIVEDELEIGTSYYIRTLNFNYVGKLAAIRHDVLVLTNASWIPEDDRFHVTLSKGTFNEVEPYPPDKRVLVSRLTISDVCEFAFPLPTEAK